MVSERMDEWMGLRSSPGVLSNDTFIRRNLIGACFVMEQTDGWAKLLIHWGDSHTTEGWVPESLVIV